MNFASAQLFLLEPRSQWCAPRVSCTWSSRYLNILSIVYITVCIMDSTTHPFSRNGRLVTMDWKL